MSSLHRRLACGVALLQALSAALAQGEEVPFITSPDTVTLEMLRAAEVGPADHLIDLGSGDGRIVVLAAKRFNATGLGVEIVPELVQRSRDNARRAGVADRVEFRVQDLFQTDLSPATVVTMYLLPEVNMQLRPRLQALPPGTRIVSHDWDLGDWRPDRTTIVPVPDKAVGLEKTSKVHLWVVPARVQGRWCGEGLLRGWRLDIQQRHQELQGQLVGGGHARTLQGRIAGRAVHADGGAGARLVLQAWGERLRVAEGSAAPSLPPGQSFVRAGDGAGCGA